MAEHVKADEPFERRELRPTRRSSTSAVRGQDYKVELIEDLVRDEGAETVSLYRNGPFEDLCRGRMALDRADRRVQAHLLAGAYWRGDETRQMVTGSTALRSTTAGSLGGAPRPDRVARERDHRKLGPQLNLFRSGGGAGNAALAPAGTLLSA